MADVFFNKSVPTSVRLGDGEERRACLDICVSMLRMSRKRELTLRLTDKNDPFFFYHVSISDDDFQGLKTQQGLRVEFDAFPHNLVELLQHCLREDSSDRPKFLLQLVNGGSTGSAQLDIVETNPFKLLVHLSLKLVLGSDSAVKKHLAGCVSDLSTENAVLQQRLSNTHSDLTRAQNLLEERSNELRLLHEKLTTEGERLTELRVQEVERERHQALTAQATAQESFQQQMRMAETTHNDKVAELERQLRATNDRLQMMGQEKSHAETALAELRMKVLTSEKEHQSCSGELQALRTMHERLEAQRKELAESVSFWQTRANVGERKVEDMAQALNKTRALLAVADERKHSVEQAASQHQQVMLKQEESVRALEEKLAKSNEVIRQLREDLDSKLAKIQVRNLVALKQEEEIEAKNKELKSLDQERQQLSESFSSKQKEIDDLQTSLTAAQRELSILHEERSKDKHTIDYLSRELTSHRLGMQPGLLLQPEPTSSTYQSRMPGYSKPAIGNGSTGWISNYPTNPTAYPSAQIAQPQTSNCDDGRHPLQVLQDGAGHQRSTGEVPPSKPSGIPVAVSKTLRQRTPPQPSGGQIAGRVKNAPASGRSENAPPKKVSWVGTTALDPQYLQATPVTTAPSTTSATLPNPLLPDGSVAQPPIVSNYFPH